MRKKSRYQSLEEIRSLQAAAAILPSKDISNHRSRPHSPPSPRPPAGAPHWGRDLGHASIEVSLLAQRTDGEGYRIGLEGQTEELCTELPHFRQSSVHHNTSST